MHHPCASNRDGPGRESRRPIVEAKQDRYVAQKGPAFAIFPHRKAARNGISRNADQEIGCAIRESPRKVQTENTAESAISANLADSTGREKSGSLREGSPHIIGRPLDGVDDRGTLIGANQH